MKVCLVAHGYPPELVGGTEKSLQNLARGLARRGVEVLVVAGSMQHQEGFRTSDDVEEVEGAPAPIRVRRIHRDDLYFDHWQKSTSAKVGEAYREILQEERPDLVHVHHWIRLTRDLVTVAAQEGIPAAVTLHDLWTSCLITFRVRPDTKEFCEVKLAPHPCLDCAALVPPKTPWVSRENQFLAFAERQSELIRELELARAVIVPSRAHGETVEEFLGVDPERVRLRVVPHGRELALRPRPPLAPPGDGGRLVLGSWGHLHPLKGPDLVIEAVKRLPDPARVELHLAGAESDPGIADSLRAAGAGLELVLHGAFAEDELERHPVTAVHAMVSGTRARESWGLVVDEAVALGLPMIVPRSGAFAERLAEGRGALFYAARDPAALAAVLQRVLDEPELLPAVRAALPPLIDVAPTIEEHVERVCTVYEEVTAVGAPQAPAADWWRPRMQTAAEEEWDRSLSQRSGEELGLS